MALVIKESCLFLYLPAYIEFWEMLSYAATEQFLSENGRIHFWKRKE